MDNINWLGLVAILMVMAIVFPGAMPHLRRSPWLRNAAIWLAALTGLIFLYQTFGPF
ncbi:hypothetical protein [Azospirillum halopraeferens]|uniref:hypothetical protein n=1 Tax=Azospirillum halopraeferens TaxID=34010 RepID=UPI0003F599C0|nr:hypothetical protein [Azospirillum halopraeferens]